MPEVSSEQVVFHAPIRAVIVEDSKRIRELVALNVERYFTGRIHIVGEGVDVKDSVPLIRKLRPQLLFLDIELVNGTGFEVLDILGDEREEMSIVVISTHEKYLKQAVSYGIVDFISKPILAAEFQQSLERCIKKIRARQAADVRLLENARARWEANPYQDARSLLAKAVHGHRAVITIRHAGVKEKTEEIVIHDITHCQAEGGYTHIYQENKSEVPHEYARNGRLPKDGNGVRNRQRGRDTLVPQATQHTHDAHHRWFDCVWACGVKSRVNVLGDWKCRGRQQGQDN